MASRANITRQPTEILINGKSLTKPGLVSGGKLLQPVIGAPHEATLKGRSPRLSPSEESAVDQVMSINRRLVTQIETLRLKVEIDARHQEAAKESIRTSTDAKVKAGEGHVKELKADLRSKDDVLKSLEDKNQQKEAAIQRLQENIKDLKDDVKISKEYASEIQSQLEQLQSATASLETGSAYTEKDEHIKQLQTEVEKLHVNLTELDKELAKAKDKIAKQGTQLRLSDIDRLNVQAKYKAELAKVTQTMRGDIERMRDVMKQQWAEMRDLREQNESMRSDIREIRDLVIANQKQTAHAQAASSNQARVYGHVHSPFNLQPLSPTLPALSAREKKRPVTGGRKKP